MSCRGLRPASIEAALMRRMNKVCTWLDSAKKNKLYADKLNKQEAEIEKTQTTVSNLDYFLPTDRRVRQIRGKEEESKKMRAEIIRMQSYQ